MPNLQLSNTCLQHLPLLKLVQLLCCLLATGAWHEDSSPWWPEPGIIPQLWQLQNHLFFLCKRPICLDKQEDKTIAEPPHAVFANFFSTYIQSLHNWRFGCSSVIYTVICPGQKNGLLHETLKICHIIPLSQEYFKERFTTQKNAILELKLWIFVSVAMFSTISYTTTLY